MKKEIWKDIDGFPDYEVSNLGNVRNKKTGHIKESALDKSTGYLKVSLWKNNIGYTKPVHRLVAENFLDKKDGFDVNHIDGNKTNNVLSNLEWCTRSENMKHAYKNGLRIPTEGTGSPIKIIETGEVFSSLKECASAIGGKGSTISMCISDKYNRSSHKGLHFETITSSEYEKAKPKRKPFLRDYQFDAVKRMHNGCILNGGVGSGKSRTGLYYYFTQQGGSIDPDYIPMKNPKDLYIITTARKRDTYEWSGELIPFLLYPTENLAGKDRYYNNEVIVDSWNNIKKYQDVKNAFFIFDEDRVTGSGAWVKSFLKIAKSNDWIILSATSGDCWADYIAVFIANGFYKNRSEFIREHVVYSRFTKYPKIDRYLNTGRLVRLRNSILVNMDFTRHTVSHHEDIFVSFDSVRYKTLNKDRWNIWDNKPIKNASELCYCLRKLVNSDESRQIALLDICADHKRVIVFYNFDYELDILKNLIYINDGDAMEIAEWNGHKHQPIPETDKWVYLVQYTAGCEGWNCIKTDTIVFFSQNYSYKVLEQARGRIDRMNTPYTDLYYYHFKSRSPIDLAISRALKNKKNFNEMKFVERR